MSHLSFFFLGITVHLRVFILRKLRKMGSVKWKNWKPPPSKSKKKLHNNHAIKTLIKPNCKKTKVDFPYKYSWKLDGIVKTVDIWAATTVTVPVILQRRHSVALWLFWLFDIKCIVNYMHLIRTFCDFRSCLTGK